MILGSSPTPSMEQYNGHENSMAKSSITASVMQSSTQTMKTFSLLNTPSLSASTANIKSNNFKNDSLDKSIGNEASQLTHPNEASGSGSDFAEQFLMGEIPADSMKVSKIFDFS